MSRKNLVCPFSGQRPVCVAEVMISSRVNKCLRFGSVCPGWLCVRAWYTLAQGSSWSFLPEDQLAKSRSHLGKSVCEDPAGRAFLRDLPCAVATRVKVGNLPKDHARAYLHEDCTGVRMQREA